MKTALLVLVFGFAVWSHSVLNVISSNGWYADLQMRDTARPFTGHWPLVLVSVRDGLTNTEFLFEDQKSYSIRLNYPDGNYNYYLYDSLKKELLEKGVYTLFTPFSAFITSISAGSATLEITPKMTVPVEASVLTGDYLVGSRRVQVKERTKMSFTNLLQNTDHVVKLSSPGFYTELEFKTSKKNLALYKPVQGTFTRFPESRFVDDTTPAITRINDGKISWYSGMAVSEELSYRDQLALIDLGTTAMLGLLKIVWHGLYYPLRYDLVYSVNGKEWRTIPRKDTDLKKGFAPDNSPIMTDEVSVKIEARYVGIKVRKGQATQNKDKLRNYVELIEIEAYE